MSGVISPRAATASSTSATSTPVPQAAHGPQPGASQFGQFRLTTFVDSNPNPMKTTTAAGKRKSMSGNPSATQSPVVRPSSVPVGVAVGASAGFEKMGGKDGVTNNGNGDTDTTTTSTTSTAKGTGYNNENQSPTTSTAPTAVLRRTASSAPKIPQGRHNGFGVLDLTPPLPPQQGKLGQHRDGRIRNPVPRKLKGKTDMRNGNFSVMHMDMSAHTSHDGGASLGSAGGGRMLSRGEQAQRTSENTAKAARVAALDKEAGKGSVKRRRVDGEGGWDPILSQASQVAVQSNGQGGALMPALPKEIVHRTEAMTPEEVKYEQARLLTLLRSLNPLAVVDQMCTALAFFGGIPGAPPPADGLNFPESEDANGSGRLFVGWLSEIFPDPQRRQWSSTKVQERAESIIQGKRPRGRPKGSKASKVRKDKGIKKGRKDGLQNNASIADAEDGDDPADDDWVDIAQGDNEAGPSGGNANAEGGMIIDLDGETPSQAAGKRKPGRLRGSRNKDKERDENGNEIPSVDVFTLSPPSQQQNHTEGNALAAFDQQPQQSPTDPQTKRKPGRPPGSKTKPKEGAPPPAPKAPEPKTSKEGPTPTRLKSVLSGAMPAGLAADERAVLEAYRKNKAIVGTATEARAPGDALNKRKRKSRAKPKPAAEGGGGQGENGEQGGEEGDTERMLAQQLNSQPQQQQPKPTQQTAVPPPPPKRQRKAKEPATNTPAAKATNSNTNIDPSLQSSQPSASPHLPATQSQNQPQSQPRAQQQPARSMSAHSATNDNPFASPPMNPMNNPNINNNINNTMMSIESMMPSSQQNSQRTAQGLEAHYERFANQDSQSQSPNTYTMGSGMGQPQQMSQAHKQGQRSSPSVAQMMQRSGSQGGQRGGMNNMAQSRSPQKSATMGGISSNTTSNMYYGGGQGQAQQQHGQRRVPTQSSGYGYNASTGMGQNQQASRSNSYNLDAFGPAAGGSINRSSMAQLPSSGAGVSQHQRGNSGYGVQSQHNTGYFDGGNIAGANYVDLPALETGLNSGYGGGLPASAGGVRSASYGGSAMGGSGMGGNMAGGLFGTEGSGISESEMRERLLRGIGRR